MAITRAQQAKQMLQDGGMLVTTRVWWYEKGYRGGYCKKKLLLHVSWKSGPNKPDQNWLILKCEKNIF